MAFLDDLLDLKKKIDLGIENKPSLNISLNQESVAKEISNKLGEVIKQGAKNLGGKIKEAGKEQLKTLNLPGWIPESIKNRPVQTKTSAPASSLGSLMAPEAQAATQTSTMDYPSLISPGTTYNSFADKIKAAHEQLDGTAETIKAAPAVAAQPKVAAGESLRKAAAPGPMAGLKEGFFGMPQSNFGQFPGQEGRTTAYYAGKMVGDLIRSRAGLNTAGQEAKMASDVPGTPQYKAEAAAKSATYWSQNPDKFTPDEMAALDADFAKFSTPEALQHIKEKYSVSTDDEALEILQRALMRVHKIKAGKYLRSNLGLSTSNSMQDQLDAMVQSLADLDANG
jgi:hypothetical protein